jgi:hypothetical protein
MNGVLLLDEGEGSFFVARDGSATRPWPRLKPYDEFSSDSRQMVTSGIDPADSLVVLFVRSVADASGATLRQVTWYDPPSP